MADCIPCGKRRRTRDEDVVITQEQAKSLVDQTASADSSPVEEVPQDS